MLIKVRKAVIIAAGMGTRFLPATKAQPKEMLPLVDKPAIQYVVEEAIGAGLTDILIVTGRNKRAIEDHFDRAYEYEHHLESQGKTEELKLIQGIGRGAKIHYIRQGDPLGTGHAVLMAEDHVGKEPFVVMLGDDVLVDDSRLLKEMLGYAQGGSSSVALMEVPRDQISSYGCASVERDDRGHLLINQLVEKPSQEEAPSNLAVIGRYVFFPMIFDAIRDIKPLPNREIPLTSAISTMCGYEKVYGCECLVGRYDTGNKLEYLKAVVHLGIRHSEVGEGFRRFLNDLRS